MIYLGLRTRAEQVYWPSYRAAEMYAGRDGAAPW